MDELDSLSRVERILQTCLTDLLPYTKQDDKQINKEACSASKNPSSKDSYNILYPIVEENYQMELLLLEIDESIKKEKQKQALESIYKTLSAYRIKDPSVTNTNTLDIYCSEMLKYDKEWQTNSTMDTDCTLWKNDRHFFNIQTSYDRKSRTVTKLSFTTRHKSMCIRINFSTINNNDDGGTAELRYEFDSDFSLENFDTKGITYLEKKTTAKCFVEEFVWPQIASLVDSL